MRKDAVATVLIIATFLLTTTAGTARAFLGGTSTATAGTCAQTGVFCDPNVPSSVYCPPGDLCIATTFFQDGTNGESSAVQSAPYECKERGPAASANSPTAKTNEDTLLTLVNEHVAPNLLCACIVLFDGHENRLTSGLTLLSNDDNDTINVCQMLQNAGFTGITKPRAGVVEIVTMDVTPFGGCPLPLAFPPQGGAYGWVKNVMYKGVPANKNIPADPYTANAIGGTRAALRVTPKGVADPNALISLCNGPPPAVLLPPSVYLDNTYE